MTNGDPCKQIRNGVWHTGDCVDVMTAMPKESIDMVITSPPYDNLRSYNDGHEWTWEIFEKVSEQLCRVIKPGGVIVWNVGDATINGSETGTSFRQALHFKDALGLRLHDTMIWNKGCFSAVGAIATRYAPVFEYMFVFTKDKIGTFNPIKDRITKHGGKPITGTIRQRDGTTKPMFSVGKILSLLGQRFNVWDHAPVKNNTELGHPAPFPCNLAEDHIISWSNVGDVVLDPFAGSGTTAIAAENTNRKWVCIERDEDYSEKAIDRINALPFL